ncbi:MAG: LacI family DNA-binding transcriptional regulator [Firmicutes bacterium]|nr:LacI family DNA-binding transcriptional regulator [Bacillota bacterium]
MATIYDIADRAGVGVGTVSRVLNNNPHVKPETRDRVIKAMEELGYYPAAMARGLARQRSDIIGVIVPFFTRPFFVEVLRGIQDAALEHGKDILLYSVLQRGQKNIYFERIPRERKVDGAVIVTLRIHDEYVENFTRRAMPLVLVDTENAAADSLVVDNVHGAQTAVRHLLGLGHRRIGFVNGLLRYRASQERLKGYQEGLHSAAITYDPVLVVEAEYDRESGRAAMAKLWERLWERRWRQRAAGPPTAIFAASDVQAIGVIEFLQSKGVRVPQDMAVVGYDDIELSRYLGITTVHQPMYEMGRRAMDILVSRLDERRNPRFLLPSLSPGRPAPERTVFTPELVVRYSCGSRPAPDGEPRHIHLFSTSEMNGH